MLGSGTTVAIWVSWISGLRGYAARSWERWSIRSQLPFRHTAIMISETWSAQLRCQTTVTFPVRSSAATWIWVSFVPESAIGNGTTLRTTWAPSFSPVRTRPSSAALAFHRTPLRSRK